MVSRTVKAISEPCLDVRRLTHGRLGSGTEQFEQWLRHSCREEAWHSVAKLSCDMNPRSREEMEVREGLNPGRFS